MKSKQLILILGAILCSLLPLGTASAFWYDSTNFAGIGLLGLDLGIPLDDKDNQNMKYGLDISFLEGNDNFKMRGASLSIASSQKECFGLSASLFNYDVKTTGLSIGLLCNRSTVTGVQMGGFNLGYSSLQIGLLNAGDGSIQFGCLNFGWRNTFLQIGLFNRAGSGCLQIGLLNHTTSGLWLPLSNFFIF